MTKKELKKAKVNIRSGYGGSSPVVDIEIEVPCLDIGGKPDTRVQTIARIELTELEDFLGKRIRGGLFKIVDKEKRQKYQRITLK